MTTFQQYPVGFSGALGSVLLLENLVGLVCNITVLAIHLYRWDTSTKPVSASFLVNLNVVDLLVCLLAIPMTTARVLATAQHNFLFCVMHEACVSMATTSSALALMLISIDRYQTIVTPFKRRITQATLPVYLVLMWVLTAVGFLFPIIALISSSSSRDSSGDNTVNSANNNLQNSDTLWTSTANTSTVRVVDQLSCSMWIRHNNIRILYELYYVVVYIIANSTMIGCYVAIYVAAKRRINTRVSIIRATIVNLPGAPTLNMNAQRQHERTITKMTLMIVMTFMLCWAPHVAVSVVMVTSEEPYMELVRIVCLALAYSATLLHPLVYAFMQKNFRDVLNKKIILRNSPRNEKPQVECRHSERKNGIEDRSRPGRLV